MDEVGMISRAATGVPAPAAATMPGLAAPAVSDRPMPASAESAPARSDAATGAAQLGPPEGYYGAIQGREGADLLFALHEVIRTGHVDRGYAQARDEMFSEVWDVDGDDMVPDLYTGEERGPLNDRKRAFQLELNAEHTWPQSRGATGIAKSDLHQVMPSDVTANSRRGSHPFGEVEHVEWSVGEGADQSRLGVDALGETVFEPRDSVKGDIARGLLYFYTRYYASRPSRFSVGNLEHELPTLLKWHEADPVDQVERARNAAVYDVQRNRNPFVDRPDLVGKIGFDELDLRSGRPPR